MLRQTENGAEAFLHVEVGLPFLLLSILTTLSLPKGFFFDVLSPFHWLFEEPRFLPASAFYCRHLPVQTPRNDAPPDCEDVSIYIYIYIKLR